MHFLALLHHVMVIRAERLKVHWIPEQVRIAAMRNDVIHHQEAPPHVILLLAASLERSIVDDAALSAVAADRLTPQMGEAQPLLSAPTRQLVEWMVRHQHRENRSAREG